MLKLVLSFISLDCKILERTERVNVKFERCKQTGLLSVLLRACQDGRGLTERLGKLRFLS